MACIVHLIKYLKVKFVMKLEYTRQAERLDSSELRVARAARMLRICALFMRVYVFN